MWKWLERLAGGATHDDVRSADLYAEIVDIARHPDWYAAGGVADDVDGRFDMVLLILSLYLVRLERDDADPRARAMSSLLIERFVADMDGSLREIGIGDLVIGKHMGRAMQALGGRLGAYREALAEGAAPALLGLAIRRNVYRGADVDTAALAVVEARARGEWQALCARPLADFVG
jgi:cytochrome b pre-mRNA-processing protein 3